jgi:hypothetical protein
MWIHPQDPGDHMLPQKVWINIDVYSLADTNENYQTLLEVTAITPRTICCRGALENGEMQMLGSTSATGRSVK